MSARGRHANGGRGHMAALLLLSLTFLAACAEGQGKVQSVPSAARPDTYRGAMAERFGIEVVALHLSSAGTMVDFRYRVLDPAKAAALLHKGAKPYLLDAVTGRRLTVPSPAYVGPLRQTAVAPQRDKIYFILFGNGGRLLKTGSRVTLVLGDARAEDLVIT